MQRPLNLHEIQCDVNAAKRSARAADWQVAI